MQAQPATRKPDESRSTARRQAMRFAAALLTLAMACVAAAAAAAPAYRLENGQVLIGASAPSVSVQRTDYAVGSTPGTLSIDRGAAAYSIPIPVPPGVAGMKPSIGLQYSSQAGNGTLGAGFSLTGLSQIGRCARTQTQDGTRGIVAYDADDRFCLDGQRLIAISGTDGANGTEYRTEIDGFSRIVSYGTAGSGPTWFKVWTKGGQVIEYGTDESAIQPAGRTDASIAVWSVKRISDTVGNQLTISYFKQSDRSESYPTRIDYPGGKVDLIYEDRPDPTQSYSQGGIYRLTKRLARIETWSGTLKHSEFRLGYQTDGVAPVSRLTSVTQCDGQGACLPPTVFTWEGGDIAFPGTQSNGLAGLCRNGSTDLGVCNGTDNFDSLQYPDVNGDGITDVCYRGDQGIQCFIGNGAGGWSTRISTGICANNSTAYGVCNDSDNFGTIRFVDLNADGRSDLFYRSDLGIQVHLSTGTGFQAAYASPLCANASPNYGGCNDSENYLSLQFSEINGDGDPDLCYRADSGIQCFLGNGQGGFSTQIASDICANGSNNYGVCNGADNWNSIRYLDLNGDGLSDLFYRGDQGIQVHFSTGSGFRLAGLDHNPGQRRA